MLVGVLDSMGGVLFIVKLNLFGSVGVLVVSYVVRFVVSC